MPDCHRCGDPPEHVVCFDPQCPTSASAVTDAMVMAAVEEYQRWPYRASTDAHMAMKVALLRALTIRPASRGPAVRIASSPSKEKDGPA